MNNAHRIIFNTGALYVRIAVNTILVLLSTRYVLSALGVIDYGLYVVIGGVMSFMGFLTSAMATSSQRHLTYELGRGDLPQLNRVFNTCFGLHFLLSLLIVLLGESLGLWFLNNILNVPEARQDAAFWVFQFTVVASACYVLAVPYQALLTAHEDFALVSIIGIAQSIFNFILALWLGHYTGDRMIAYGLLSCSIAIFTTLAQIVLARYRYPESKLNQGNIFEPSMVKKLASFSGWSLFGSLSIVARIQGLAFLFNIFFGPIANAAFGIANQINGAMSQFTQAILQAVSPRLVKHESNDKREQMLSGALLVCKFSFFVACLWAVPLFAEIPTILQLWLTNPPAQAVVFCQLMILIFVCDQLSAGLSIPFHAIGKIARYQVIGGLIHLSTLPLAYLLIKLGGNEKVVLYASLLTICINMFFRGYLLRGISNFSYYNWLQYVVFQGTVAVLPSVLCTCIILKILEASYTRLIVVILSSLAVSIVSILLIGMTRSEREQLLSIARSFNLKTRDI